MRNRAKCKLCGEVIESMHKHDYVVCKCGEIAVDGGQEYSRCVAAHKENFLKIDDEGNAVEIKHAAPLKAPNASSDVGFILEEVIKEAIVETERVIEYDSNARVTQFDVLSLLYLLKELAKRLPQS